MSILRSLFGEWLDMVEIRLKYEIIAVSKRNEMNYR